jgi:two-component system, cell cycle response regulator
LGGVDLDCLDRNSIAALRPARCAFAARTAALAAVVPCSPDDGSMSATLPNKSRILLVDDSPVMRKAASKMLGEEFDVATATDGVDAWEKIQADTTIQVIFTDLSMPRMDGYALLQKIRAAEDEGTLNMPVIVVTGAENDESARKKALDLGATDFITKPFGSIDLLARARAHANYRRIARKLEQQITLDALTGLANKAGFLDRLQQDIAFASRYAQPLSVVRIDIDDFRNVFLKQGKSSAEALIQHVARTLHDRVRKEDTAARIGLASFALALAAGQHEGSKGLIERLRAEFQAAAATIAGKPLAFTISAAVYTPALNDAPGATETLEACEALLQSALQAGGNRVVGKTTAAATPVEASPAVGATNEVVPAAVVRATPTAATPTDEPKAKATTTTARTAATRATSAPDPAPPPKAASAAADTKTAASVAGDASDSPVLVDEALKRIERGESQAVVPKLPQLVMRLLPLLRLLSPHQRTQLVGYLQKLG